MREYAGILSFQHVEPQTWKYDENHNRTTSKKKIIIKSCCVPIISVKTQLSKTWGKVVEFAGICGNSVLSTCRTQNPKNHVRSHIGCASVHVRIVSDHHHDGSFSYAFSLCLRHIKGRFNSACISLVLLWRWGSRKRPRKHPGRCLRKPRMRMLSSYVYEISTFLAREHMLSMLTITYPRTLHPRSTRRCWASLDFLQSSKSWWERRCHWAQ